MWFDVNGIYRSFVYRSMYVHVMTNPVGTPTPARPAGVGPDATDLQKFVVVMATPKDVARPQDYRPRPADPTQFEQGPCVTALLGQVRGSNRSPGGGGHCVHRITVVPIDAAAFITSRS